MPSPLPIPQSCIACAALLFTIGFGPACSTIDHAVVDRTLPVQLGARDASRTAPPAQDDTPWWSQFEDDALTALVERAHTQNLSLRQMWARLEQSRALADQAQAARLPTVGLNGSIGWSQSVSAFGSSTGQSASVSLPVSYEVDLFSRAAFTHRAANLEADATADDLAAATISLSAQVAESWYDVVNARAREALIGEQLEMDNTYLELVRLRFREGLASSVDVHQQRLQTARTTTQLEQTAMGREIAEQRLSLLLGEIWQEDSVPPGDTLPELEPAPFIRPTADLLRNRPDIRAASRRVEAADRRVAAAIAGRLPSIRLNVTPGYAWNRSEFGDDSPFAMGGARTSGGFTLQAGASFNVALFDGFRGSAQVRLGEAQFEGQVENLHAVVLQALFEVEMATRQEGRLLRNHTLLETQASIADETLAAAQSRFRSGLSDYLPVLRALQARHSLRLLMQDSRRQLLSSRIQLHRALGGVLPNRARPEPNLAVEQGSDEDPNADASNEEQDTP